MRSKNRVTHFSLSNPLCILFVRIVIESGSNPGPSLDFVIPEAEIVHFVIKAPHSPYGLFFINIPKNIRYDGIAKINMFGEKFRIYCFYCKILKFQFCLAELKHIIVGKEWCFIIWCNTASYTTRVCN